MNQNSHIQQDSYWFIEGESESAKMNAICVICAKKQNKGWFWEGSRLGYGDYDLFCSSCNNVIYMRNKDVKNKTDNKNQ